MTNTTSSLIEKIEKLEPYKDDVDYLERKEVLDIIRQHEAVMGDAKSGTPDVGLENEGSTPSVSPNQTLIETIEIALQHGLAGDEAYAEDRERIQATRKALDALEQLRKPARCEITEQPAVFYGGLFDAACEKMEKKWQKTDDNAHFHDVGALRGYLYDFLLFYISTLPKREIVEEWQPPHEWNRYGMGIVRSRLLEDHVYLQEKNGDIWRVCLEMDGRPIIECVQYNAPLPKAKDSKVQNTEGK